MLQSNTPLSIQADLATLEALAQTPALSASELVKALQAIYQKVATADFSDYDVRAVAKSAPEIMYRLFDVRIALRNRMSEFEQRGFMTADVQQALRDCFRILRYVTDMVGEVRTGNARYSQDALALPAFRGPDYNTLVNYAFYKGPDLPFKSGDVMLMRGQAHNSAAIARIGDIDSQFSHLAMIYIDDAGQHFVVESLIEDGAIVNTLPHSLAHGSARAVLYRHKDPVLAARAAKMIHDHVAPTRKTFARRILYDFSMRLDEGRRLFCAKVVRLAFQMASEGRTNLPRYPTKLAMKNRDFLNRIGVTATQTFAPADIDLETSFDLVCEWQDYRGTSNIRLQDFTCDKLFEWMDRYEYRFEETMIIRIVSLLGRFTSYFSDTAKDILASVAPKVPINMPRKAVAAVAMLHKTAEPIVRELRELEAATVRQTGRPMHGNEIFEALERIRLREGNRIGYLVSKVG